MVLFTDFWRLPTLLICSVTIGTTLGAIKTTTNYSSAPYMSPIQN